LKGRAAQRVLKILCRYFAGWGVPEIPVGLVPKTIEIKKQSRLNGGSAFLFLLY
jgi:hypothetical protein